MSTTARITKAQRQGKEALDIYLGWREQYGTPQWITLYEAHDLTDGLVGKPVNKPGAAAMIEALEAALKMVQRKA